MIEGVSHITFIVKDLEKTASFLKEIFGAKEVYSKKTVKYFLIANQWIALNFGDPLSEKTYNHVAFKVSKKEFGKYKQLVEDFGVEIKVGRTRKNGEADSIYFYDYDNHLFEIHSGTLEERLEAYLN